MIMVIKIIAHGDNMKSLALLSLLLPILSAPAHAGEGLFSRAYTTETVPGGHFELEQTARLRTQRAFGSYTAIDSKSEFEYGITDALQGALYVNSGYVHAVKASDDNDQQGETGFDRNQYSLDSITMEFLYRALSPVSDPIGLAFYIEPGYIFHDFHNGDKEYNGFENEMRVIFQKNFFEDQLILVYNLVAEFEFFRYKPKDALFTGEFDFNNEIGASYRVGSNLYAGLEARNHNEFGNFWSHDHSLVWVGPAIHYGGPKWWGTLGVLKQIYGNPNGPDGQGSFQGNHLFLHSHEEWEITAKIGFPF